MTHNVGSLREAIVRLVCSKSIEELVRAEIEKQMKKRVSEVVRRLKK